MIYSSSYVWSIYKFGNRYHYLVYQLIFMLFSVFITYLIYHLNLDYIKRNINKFLFLIIVFLILVVIPGIGVVRNGSRSWFRLGPFSLQPSEFSKIVLVLFTSKYLEKYHRKINSIKSYLIPILLVLFLIIFLVMLEPDFGSSVVVILTICSLIFISGINSKIIVTTILTGLLLFSLIIISAPYRLLRIISFINPWSDPLGSGYQIIQSLYAIGPAGLYGHGVFKSIQKHFYLPEPHTDFIFAIFIEEFGFIFSVIVLFIFFIFFYNVYKLSIKQKNMFNKFMLFGILSSLTIQTLINLSVVVGLVPVTGVTLPFFSYGGSSLISTGISLGLILNVTKEK